MKRNLTPLLNTLVFLTVLLGLAPRGAYGMTGYEYLYTVRMAIILCLLVNCQSMHIA